MPISESELSSIRATFEKGKKSLDNLSCVFDSIGYIKVGSMFFTGLEPTEETLNLARKIASLNTQPDIIEVSFKDELIDP